jgi:hypothetical protein
MFKGEIVMTAKSIKLNPELSEAPRNEVIRVLFEKSDRPDYAMLWELDKIVVLSYGEKQEFTVKSILGWIPNDNTSKKFTVNLTMTLMELLNSHGGHLITVKKTPEKKKVTTKSRKHTSDDRSTLLESRVLKLEGLIKHMSMSDPGTLNHRVDVMSDKVRGLGSSLDDIIPTIIERLDYIENWIKGFSKFHDAKMLNENKQVSDYTK